MNRILALQVFTTLLIVLNTSTGGPAGGTTGLDGTQPLSPTALAVSPEGNRIYVACATANRVLVYDVTEGKVEGQIQVQGPPLGLVLSKKGDRLLVACAAPESVLCEIDTGDRLVKRTIAAGHTAMAPVLSPDEKTLYVCHRFNNEVAFVDLESGKVVRRVPVPREPVSLALTPDGKHLLVANHIHAGRADLDVVASSVSVIDVGAAKKVREIELPNGSGLLRDIRISPDGKYAVVAHLLSRYQLPTTQIERGWINSNAISIFDLATFERINTVLLDNIDRGAANPWGVAWSGDGKQLLVTHAGTHQVSVIDFPGLLAKLAKLPATLDPTAERDYTVASHTTQDVPNDLSFLVGLRERIQLEGKGPRAIVVTGNKAWVANYFSDSLSELDLSSASNGRAIALAGKTELKGERLGEFYFNDATICFQGWQSCASCHSSDARVDGLNWDNLNDGIGNPKNAKSLLLAHQTPPSMALGVRENAEVGVRAGIRHSLFTVQPEEVPEAIDAYLKSLRPIPSPRLVKGELSDAALRGRLHFMDEQVGCATCHPAGLYTDMKRHDVGTRGRYDAPGDRFDTPTLVELWRTAPYLHDGSADTVMEMLTSRDPEREHGNIGGLTPEELSDLVEYVLSL